MRKLTALLAVVLSLTVVSVGVASGAAKGTDRPYKDKGSATLDLSDITNVSITGTRNATHLGKSTWTTSNVVIDLSQLGNGIVGVTYDDTITAANGDTLTTTAVATINVSDLTGPPLPFSAVETITGGTGRFAGASGTFTVTGSVDIITQVLTFTSAGSISY
jgi:hypothetical protein